MRASPAACPAPRMGENDAWLVATADALDADVVRSDRAVFERLFSTLPALQLTVSSKSASA